MCLFECNRVEKRTKFRKLEPPGTLIWPQCLSPMVCDIYLMYERQRKKYQEEIHQNMLQIMNLIDRVNHVYLYYLQLTPKEHAILKAIYMEKKQYKEIIKEGMSESSINRIRKRAIRKIIQRWKLEL